MLWTDYLEHYGILGMKWGIRRWQPYGKGEKKGKFLGLDRDAPIQTKGKPVSYTKGTHGDILGQTRDKDLVIKKGTTAYRLQEGAELQPGQKYISFDKLDHMRYISNTAGGEFGLTYTMMYDQEGKAKSGSAKSITLELTNDLIAPSYEKTMDAFIDTIGKVKLSDIFDEPKTPAQVEQQKEFLNDVKSLSIDECRDRAYLNFSRVLMKDTPAREMFFDNLKKQGYNAVVDENDKRFGEGLTGSPVITFDASSLKTKKVTPIDKEDIDYFSELYWGGGSRPKYDALKKKWEKYSGLKESQYWG